MTQPGTTDELLPLTVDARPASFRDRMRKNPLTWAGCAAVSVFGAAYLADGGLSPAWTFGAYAVGWLVALACSSGLSHLGCVIVDEQQVWARAGLRTRTVHRSRLREAVEVTHDTSEGRGPGHRVTAVRVLDDAGRCVFSMDRSVFDRAGIDAVLDCLQLPLREVPGTLGIAGLESMAPGSVSVVQRRPFPSAAVLLLVILVLSIVALLVHDAHVTGFG